MSMLAKETRLEVRDRAGSYAVPEAGGGAVPAGYKPTEVGAIPDGWQTAALKRFSAFITKGSTPTTYGFKWERSGIIFLRSECVSEHGLDLAQSMYISQSAHALLRRSEVSDGDILITITGNVGRVVLLSGIGSANLNQHIARVRITNGSCDPKYVFQYLAQPSVRARLGAITTGQAYPQISLKQVRDLEVALPPAEEQRAIAAALSDVDALLAKLDQLIAKKRDFKQAAQQQLLDARARLAGFSKRWSRVRLGDLLQFQVGYPFISAYFNKAGQGIRIIKNRDLKGDDSIFHYTGRYDDDFVVKNGDVLIGMDGDFIPCKWNGGDAILNQRVGRILVKEGLDPLYAYYALSAPLKKIEEITSSTTVKHLSHTDVENIELDLPEKLEQTAIAAILSDMDAELAALEARRAKTYELKQGMMQALLTGRIRLI